MKGVGQQGGNLVPVGGQGASGEADKVGNSVTEADPTTGQRVLEMNRGFWGILRGKQKPNLTTNILLVCIY